MQGCALLSCAPGVPCARCRRRRGFLPTMRVRQLLNCLQEEGMVQHSSLSDLEGLRIGLDATCAGCLGNS